MATGTILLPILGALSAPTAPPAIEFTTASNRPHLAFDGSAVIESVSWTLRMPENYASGLIAKIQWSASGAAAPTSPADTCQWTVSVMAMVPGASATMLTDSYDTENVVASAASNTVARRLEEASLALANADGVAAGNYVAIQLLRDYSDAADTLVEDAWLWAISLEYTLS